MRRLLSVALAAAMLSLAVSASATSTENYKDKFTSIGWGGSDGSLAWSGPWSEIGDDGDEKKGNVRVVSSGNCISGNCMRISALTTLVGSIGAGRSADTSDLEDPSLSFDLKATAALLGSQLLVQVNDGQGWDTVATYQLGGAAQTDHPTIDVGDYRSEDFSVRFLFSGLLLTSEVFIDNVEILGTFIEEPATTTTTTAGTTTTTAGDTTTTSQPSTTTTRPKATTTTAEPETTTSTSTTTEGPDQGTPATTSSSTTTTTIAAVTDGPGPGGDGTPPEGSGIRAAARGLQANFQGDLYGEVRTVSALNGVDLQADYNMAVEVVEASWAWMVLLGLLIAWSILSGLDRRRGHLDH